MLKVFCDMDAGQNNNNADKAWSCEVMFITLKIPETFNDISVLISGGHDEGFKIK